VRWEPYRHVSIGSRKRREVYIEGVTIYIERVRMVGVVRT
jgi:hypothetical protein